MVFKVKYSWWRLKGIPFYSLSDSDRDVALSEWLAVISTIKSGVVLARRIPGRYRYKEFEVDTARYEYYALAPIEVDLSRFFNAVREEPLRPGVAGLRGFKTLVLESGELARVYVAFKFPLQLPEGFTYMLLAACDEVALVFERTPRARALSIADSLRRRRMGIIGVREEASVELAGELASRVIEGAELYVFYLLLVLKASSTKVLEERTEVLESTLRGYSIEAEAPPLQPQLYSFKAPGFPLQLEERYTDTFSLKPFFPLIDEELNDEGGVFLGVSSAQSPVVLDLWSKPNLNFTILGVSGSGKSMTVKIFLKRLREQHPSIVYMGVDPESEYTRVAGVLRATAIEIREGWKLGLDPVKLMLEGVLELGQVADLLSELYAIPPKLQGLLRKELFLKAELAGGIEGFVEAIENKQLKRLLEGAVAPPDVYVYEGTAPEIGGSAIFGLASVRSKRLKVLISALMSAYASNKLLAGVRRSVLFIDEAWLFTETPSVMSLVENAARRGRKHGVAFIYVTQRAEDLARTPQGRSILEQSATVLILRQEPEGRDTVKTVYRLSETEADMLVNAPPGYGLLKAGDKRLFTRILATREELELFSTRGV
ncbi:MAG: DUF87 domain-containing protein [Desulfurococcus sp.]|nr:DUF87 domain-containing protein [Desulfurococcus sp.]